jgi:hypothetical protein
MKAVHSHNYCSILSKICLGSTISYTDPSNFNSLFGYRDSLFSFINPFITQYSLRIGFSFIENFLKKNYNILFVIKLQDTALFSKFNKVCKRKNFALLKDSEISSGFLTNRKTSNLLLVTLFLDHRKTQLIQKESLMRNIPLISFNDLSSNRFSSTIAVVGSYSSFLSRDLILSLLSVCLEQKFAQDTKKSNIYKYR